MLAPARLADDPADGLQGGELLVVQVEGLVGRHIPRGQHLLAPGADAAVQVGARVRLPGVFPVLLGLARLLLGLRVGVRGQQFLLLGRVRKQHQEFVEDLPEVLAQELLAASVILSGRNQTLAAGEKRRRSEKGEWVGVKEFASQQPLKYKVNTVLIL